MFGREENLRSDRSWLKTTVIEQEKYKTLGFFTSIRNIIEEMWYFDSGCSQHMTRNKCFLTNLQPFSHKCVIFKDGGKERVMGNRFFNPCKAIQAKGFNAYPRTNSKSDQRNSMVR